MIKKITHVIIMFLLSVFVYGQEENTELAYNYVVRSAVGDLNNDSLNDGVTIAMDTISESRPFKLKIFLKKPNGEYHLFFSSTQIIEAMYPAEKNGEYNGSQVPDVDIEDGKLQLYFYIHGNSKYEFRLKEDEFELIHFEYVKYEGETITEITFNLLSGQYSKKVEVIKTSRVMENFNKEALLRPLPSLNSFKPLVNELY